MSLMKVRILEKRTRDLGMCLIVDVDGRLKIFPGYVVAKHRSHMYEILDNIEELKTWLLILAKPQHGQQ